MTENGKSGSENLQELEIVRRAQAGDEEAFEELYKQCREKIYKLCLRIVGNPEEAEDISQETFLRLWKKIKQFRGESAFQRWLYMIAVRQALMALRKKKGRIVTTSIEDLDFSVKPTGGKVVTIQPDQRNNSHGGNHGGSDVGRSNNHIEEKIYLKEALEKLSKSAPGQKAVFFLYDVKGYGHHEIAEILGCSPGNSKSQLYRARRRLRVVLGNITSPRPIAPVAT